MKKVFPLLLLSMFFTCAIFGNHYTQEEILNDPLIKEEMSENPMDEMVKWYEMAVEKLGKMDASTMILATMGKGNIPSQRPMQAKVVDKRGVVFCGDARSGKFQHLKKHPFASLCFYWDEIQRYVSISGKVELVTREEAIDLFRQRSFSSKIATHASTQGSEIESRDALLESLEKHKELFQQERIPTPDHWVGYLLVPSEITFWVAGADNMHSMVRYSKEKPMMSIFRKVEPKWESKLIAP